MCEDSRGIEDLLSLIVAIGGFLAGVLPAWKFLCSTITTTIMCMHMHMHMHARVPFPLIACSLIPRQCTCR